jgi:hypothetical protein
LALDHPDYAFLWAWEPLDPARLAAVLDGFACPWWIAGGLALDLAIGANTRAHGDLDVAILRRDQARLWKHLAEWDLFRATPDDRLEPWQGELLESSSPAVWARRTADAPWLCEFLLNDCDDDLWHFPADASITRPLADIGATSSEGFPILAPEVVLLFKASEPSPKNDADFRAALPKLAPEARTWLAAAIRARNASHPWLAELTRRSRP